MRELLTAQETTKILGLRTSTQLYKLVDFFDSDPEDEWLSQDLINEDD